MNAEMYERALETTGQVVRGTRRDQLENPTPCSDWNVRDLLNHLIGGCLTFAAGGAGEPVPMDTGTDHTNEDLVGAYDRAAKSALEVFRSPQALERNFNLPWGETPGSIALFLAISDAVVHGWDLARATGQQMDIEDDIADAIYEMTTEMLEPKGSYPRGDSFRPPVDVPEDAAPADRMLAYMGRRP